MHALARESFDVVLIDLNYTRDTTSGREGLELLSRIRALNRDVPVVAMTAWGSIELAVDAMRTGVDDFIQKPWDNAQLLSHLRTQIEQGRAHRRLQQVPSDSGRASELAAAREIQRNLLPTTLPAAPGLQVAVFWEPAGDVGGDFYDGASLSESSAWLCIGDVAGKGISAALLMASVQSMVRSSARAQLAPAALCASVNRELSTQMTSGRFVTFFYCVYDATTRRLTYTNAGHNPPLLVHSDGNAVRLSRGGPVLGVFPQSQFDSGEVELADGDRLVLFTDGITEARSASGGEFGEERLERIVAASPQVSARALSDRILSAARTFRGEAFEDDATLIVMEVGGR
jgi:sigma-B regulation protein RsbU (phosphoserine phosphatase)